MSYKGTKLSQESKDKIGKSNSVALKGRRIPQEVKNKISNSNKGRIFSKEHRNKLSKSRIGIKYSNETKLKMSLSTKGDKHPNWKGGISKKSNYFNKRYLNRLENIAGRPKPEKCEICKGTRKICFDHDHATGKFRGWICSRCNMFLGIIENEKNLIDLLLEYLKKN